MYSQTSKTLGTIGIAGGKAALKWWQQQTPEDKARYQQQGRKIATKAGQGGRKIATKTGHLGLHTGQRGLRGMRRLYGRIQEEVQERQEKTAGPNEGASKQGAMDTLADEEYAEKSRRETANGNRPVQHT